MAWVSKIQATTSDCCVHRQVLALMSCDVARMGHIQCHVEQAKWSRILDVSRAALAQRLQ